MCESGFRVVKRTCSKDVFFLELGEAPYLMLKKKSVAIILVPNSSCINIAKHVLPTSGSYELMLPYVSFVTVVGRQVNNFATQLRFQFFFLAFIFKGTVMRAYATSRLKIQNLCISSTPDADVSHNLESNRETFPPTPLIHLSLLRTPSDYCQIVHLSLLRTPSDYCQIDRDTMTSYGLDGPKIESQQMHKIFTSIKPSKLALEPSQLPIQWVPGSLPGGTAAEMWS